VGTSLANKLTVSGEAALDGTINIVQLDNFRVEGTIEVDVLLYDSHVGVFANVVATTFVTPAPESKSRFNAMSLGLAGARFKVQAGGLGVRYDEDRAVVHASSAFSQFSKSPALLLLLAVLSLYLSRA